MSRQKNMSLVAGLVLAGLNYVNAATAAQIFVGGAANAVGIVDQHPLARNEALYDTQPNATGAYNRTLDADTVNPARRYDALPEYYDNSTPAKLRMSLVNGAWWCGPTAALSIVKYWDTDPRFGNLFDPDAGDTDRSVLLDLGARMDTDDVANMGGNDAQERHLGTRLRDLLPGLQGYVDAKYPTFFKAKELYIGQPGVTFDQFAAGYAAAIQKGIPVLLLQKSHVVVGTGFDDAFTRKQPEYYRVNNPWDASQNVNIGQVGQGRVLPGFSAGVFGISYAEELYGPGADVYDDNPSANPDDALPYGMIWLEAYDAPLEIPEVVPLPAGAWLFGGALGALGWVRRRQGILGRD